MQTFFLLKWMHMLLHQNNKCICLINCKFNRSGKQTSSTMEQLDTLLNSEMSDNQKDETGHQSLNYL